MSDDAHVLDLLSAYALGSLDSEETRRVEQHLLSCLICRDESNTLQGFAEQLSFAAPVAVPSPDLKDRLMQRIQVARPPQHQVTKRPWRERFLPLWGLASLCLVVVLAGLNLFLWQRLAPPTVASRSGMRTAPLSPPNQVSEATGYVLVSEDGDSGALVVDGLPPLEDGRQYQLWLIRDGQITNGAIFSTDEKSYGTARIRASESLLEYSAVDITIEPAGGSPQPTGRKVLGGPLFNP
jgi:anti-sigma-K factor RskA